MTASPHVAERHLDPLAPGFFDDPYPQYRAAREVAPVHFTDFGAWLVLGHDDVVHVLRDQTLSVEGEKVGMSRRNAEFEAALDTTDDRDRRSILDMDPPDHTRIRRLFQMAFTPRRIEGLADRIQALVDDALDAAAGDGSMDVIADLAFPLPFTVISEMLGMPDGDTHQLRAWSHTLAGTLDPLVEPELIREAIEASDHMGRHIEDVIAWKRREPGDDLLSALIAAEDAGDVLTHQELRNQVVLLYIAGHETTVNLIGNGALALLRAPDQLARWHEEPDVGPNAVEELLRYDSPVQFSRRFTLEDIDVGGVTIPARSLVLTCLGSANHDPAVFGDDADDLRLDRHAAPHHVSFGNGIHHCVGAALARLEARLALGTLVQRFPDMTLATDEPAWNGRLVLRGLDRLPVTLT